MTGTPQNKHLEKIEDDQSIQGIDRIDDTIRNDAGRKWFVSQAVQPVIVMGQYNNNTGRIHLNNCETAVSYSTASAASLTLTCPANTVYKIKTLTAHNNTRAPAYTLTANIAGQAITIFAASTAGTAGRHNPIIGGAPYATNLGNITPDIQLNGGDTLTITDTTYVAADDTEYSIIYEVVA